jgi:DNA polymerase III alpha subunit
VQIRKKDGDFKNIFDFCERVGGKIINKKTVESLIKSGSFDSIHENRKQLFDSFEILNAYTRGFIESKNSRQMNLFDMLETEHKIYPRLVNTDNWQGYEKFQREFEVFGFYLQNHPLDIMRDELDSKGITFLIDALNNDEIKDGAIVKIAGVVITTSVKSSDKGRYAFITFSDPTGMTEVSLFKNELITEHKEWLDDKVHMQLVLECNISKKENAEPRILVGNMSLLDDYLRNTAKGTEKVKYVQKKDFNSFNFKNKDNQRNDAGIDVVKEQENLKNEKIASKITIYTDSMQVVRILQNILLGCKKIDEKFTEISLIIEENKIQLPNDYRISVPVLNDIRNMHSVGKVEYEL